MNMHSDYSDTSDSDHHYQSPAKRRRVSMPKPGFLVPSLSLFSDSALEDGASIGTVNAAGDACEDVNENIGLSATSKQAGQTVAPFLARHIPDQYAPMGGLDAAGKAMRKDPNTKFCYRHRPDLKCRRQVNEPSMDQLQHELEDLAPTDQQAIAHVWSVFSASPAKQRNLILQGILSQCCFPQLSYLSTSVRELIRIDFLSALPTELAFKVLCSLDTTSLCKAAQVSQRWRLLADDDVVWHRMCEQHIDRKCTKCGWGLPMLERKQLRASKRQIQLRATGRGLNEWSPNITPYPETAPSVSNHGSAKDTDGTASSDDKDGVYTTSAHVAQLALQNQQHHSSKSSRLEVGNSYFQPRTRPWKDVYKDRFKVCTNWKYGRCNIKIFKGHGNGVMCLQFDDRILVTGSYDTTIKVWDIESGEELRTLRGHTSGVRCLQFDDTKLISGSLDHTVKVWNWRTGECLSTYTGHSDGIVGLHFDGPALLATSSIDRTIKVWNFADKSASVLRGHGDWVNAVRVDAASRTVFSASDDCTVKLWDIDRKTCIKTFEGHVGQVQQVVALPHDFEFEENADIDGHDGASSSTSSSVPPAPKQSIDHPTTEPYGPGFTSCDRPLPPRYILTGALDSTIRLWDTSTGKCLRTYFGHVEGVWALAADALRVVSGAQDRMVKVWDTRGKCERTFTGHAGPVTCIGLSERRMCTGGEDGEVRMYKF